MVHTHTHTRYVKLRYHHFVTIFKKLRQIVIYNVFFNEINSHQGIENNEKKNVDFTLSVFKVIFKVTICQQNTCTFK